MTRIRFRTDSWISADEASRLDRGEALLWHDDDDPNVLNTPVAFPGDTWRLQWHSGPLAGYAICCPKCLRVHPWGTALNCGSRNADGICAHNGVGSCWDWTGSAEDGTLTASPSLHCLSDRGGCGWHGWLQGGLLTEC